MVYILGAEPSEVGSESVGGGGGWVVRLFPFFVFLTVIPLPFNYSTQRGWHI